LEEQGKRKWMKMAPPRDKADTGRLCHKMCSSKNSEEKPDSGTRRLYGCMTAWLRFEQGTKIQVEKPLDWDL
jgi:hypothetical protein